jgi:hypothetical protein
VGGGGYKQKPKEVVYYLEFVGSSPPA